MLVGVVGFLGSEVVLSPVVSRCLRLSPCMWGVRDRICSMRFVARSMPTTATTTTTTTSSTAQGGGGSFKNRKRIGEIDCCEGRMSEQKH